MQLSAKGFSLIQEFEGFSASIYKDATGFPTVGYGHLLKACEATRYAHGITHEEAELLLRVDVSVAVSAVKKLVCVPLRQHQFDALVSFTYNLGGGTLERSTLRRKLNRSEYEEVPDEFLRYVWAGGRKLAGLMRRRQAEARLFAVSNQITGQSVQR